jgi:hypothetical protein
MDAAREPSSKPSAPAKAEQVAQFLQGELQQLFRTGVSIWVGQR